MELLGFLSITIIIPFATSAGVLPGPNFVGEIKNATVVAGRDAVLSCQVEHLRGYKVAWVQVDTQTILTIHTVVITRNPRIGLSREEHNVYNLHIKNAHEEDRGWYMCQINTDPMIRQLGYLQVVVSPDFEKSSWVGDQVVREGTNVTLECKARGYPPPVVTWRRENPTDPSMASEKIWEGETLFLEKVSRLNMGAFLCVASNGIQPSVSQRLQLKVQFPPMLWIPNQLEGANRGETAVLECNTEAYPKSINYWTNDRGEMIADGAKYSTEIKEESYKTYMKLTIRNLTKTEFTSYKCIAKNSLGETDGTIKLYEMHPKPEEEENKEANTISKLGNHKEIDLSDVSLPDNRDNEIFGSNEASIKWNLTSKYSTIGRSSSTNWRGKGNNDVLSELDPYRKDKKEKKNKMRMQTVGRQSPFDFLSPSSAGTILSSLILLISVVPYLL